MPLRGHLVELRSRSLRVAIALVVAAAAGFWASDLILDVLRTPILELADSRNATLNYTTLSAAFDLRLRIAVYTAVVLTAPVWLWQLLAFCRPGMTRREQQYTLGFLAAAIPLFLAGCVVGVWLFPNIVSVLAAFGSDADSTILDAGSYFDFVVKLVGAAGLAFVLPAILVLLNLLGIVRAATLRRGWRVALVGIVVFSALITPAADLTSMFLLAIPMTALFAAAVAIATIHDRVAARRAVAGAAHDDREPVLAGG